MLLLGVGMSYVLEAAVTFATGYIPNILLAVSAVSLILCEVLNSLKSIYWEGQDDIFYPRRQHRRRMERLRNLSLTWETVLVDSP